MSERSPFLKSFDWVEENLGSIKLLDASWYLPAQNRDGKADFAAAHIPGAQFFDHDAIVDPASTLPHALPSPETFATAMGALGISQTDTIIVYDGPGMFSAPRAWWMLRIFGARESYVLDGGFDAWKAEGRPVSDATETPRPAIFNPSYNNLAVVGLAEMRTIVDEGTIQIADARPAGRFTGEVPEPRAGMRSGHMPGAFNMPFNLLAENGRLKPVAELKATLEAAGLDLEKPVVTSCGSGVTAAVITLALQSVGHRYNMLYDGSWSEWGSRDDTPVVTGP